MSRQPVESKQALRREMRVRLAAVDADTRQQHAAAVAERVLSLDTLRRPGRVLSCLSFEFEIDTRRLIERLLSAGHEVYVPRADMSTRALSIHRYPCDLEILSFGLEQPVASAAGLADDDIDRLDLALIVGLAFDRRGYRLGHGGGFFDRFLALHPVPAVGLAYEIQIVDRLPVEPHDRPMDRVISEHREIAPAEL